MYDNQVCTYLLVYRDWNNKKKEVIWDTYTSSTGWAGLTNIPDIIDYITLAVVGCTKYSKVMNEEECIEWNTHIS